MSRFIETLNLNRISPRWGYGFSSVLCHRAMPYVNDFRALPYNPLFKAESLSINSIGQRPMTQNDGHRPMRQNDGQHPMNNIKTSNK